MKTNNWNKSMYLLRGLLLAYIITFTLILFFSLLLTYTSLREGKMPLLNTVSMVISITSGSIYSARKLKERGWMNGGIIGIGYYLILLILNFLFLRPFILDIFSITKLVLAFITGVIGGIIGINI